MRTILIFTAKSSRMSFGGNDTFVLQLVSHWPSSDDTIILGMNNGHPCRALFSERLGSRARIELFNERMTWERRSDMADRHAGKSFRSAWGEFIDDCARPFTAAASILRMARHLKTFKPDAVFVNAGGNPPEDLAWRMLIAARLCRVKRVVLVEHIYPGYATNPFRAAALAVLRKVTRFLCDEVVAPSMDCARILGDSMGMPGPTMHIPYGIEASPLAGSLEAKRHKLGLRTNGPVIGCIANMEERKGVLYLVRAMARIHQEFPDAVLILLGFVVDPVYADRMQSLTTELGLVSCTRILGYMPDANQYFECFDVCVVPSLFAESFGIVAIEAMRYSKPVVLTSIGGLQEVVINKESGLIVPPRDADALADAILGLLRFPRQREAMGVRGHERFLSEFTSERMAERYSRLVESTV